MSFWNLHEMENIFEKKESLLAYVFPNYIRQKTCYLSAWKALLQNSLR